MQREEQFQRFGLQFRLQHAVLAVSTTALILTGVPLWCLGRPEYAWWNREALHTVLSLANFRLAHRAAALVLIAVSAYHLFYTVCSREGRREFAALLPRFRDMADVARNSLYFLGLVRERPRFGRYTYYEKFDYWAVYWGCVIMIGTGLVLWLPGFAAAVPWLPYGLARVIHSDEAILAALALFVWHFYNVHYNPSRFPGTLLWWHGRIPRGEMEREHPLELEEILRGSAAAPAADGPES